MMRFNSSLGPRTVKACRTFRQAAAVLRGGQTVEESPLGICHLDARFANPHIIYSEESAGLGLDELVARSCNQISAGRPTISCSACPWHRPGRREYEHLSRDLLGQSVMTERGPVADGRRLDKGHRDLEFMGG